MPRTRRSSKIIGVDISRFEGTLTPEDILQPQQESNTVSVMLMKEKIVKVVGKSTGRLYVFNGAGSIIEDVDRTDAEDMINKHPTPSCCGSYPTPYFKIL